MIDNKSGGRARQGYKWIGPGTWLIDRRHYGPWIGVITSIDERDRGRAARLSIYWRNDRYQNVSLASALDYLISGDWRVDDER